MKKEVSIPAEGNIGQSQNIEEAKQTLNSAFAQANPGMTLADTKDVSIDATGNLSGKAKVALELPEPTDPTPLARSAWKKMVDRIRDQRGLGPSPEPMLEQPAPPDLQIEAMQNEDEDDIIEPEPLPEAEAEAEAVAPPAVEPPRPLKFLFEAPEAAPAPEAPAPSDLEHCPDSGDGGDPQLNVLKNRKKKGSWQDVEIQRILDLDWDTSIERRHRADWSPDAMEQVHENEKKGALRIEGWLAGAKKEGAESCNCHSPTEVDYHLWVVDDEKKATKANRFQSVVCEVTPRVRAEHDGWDIDRIAEVVKSRTKVRLSGWLMMDQEHPEQLPRPGQHSTRGTLWEMHPIIEFEIDQDGEWVSLDDADL
jgi:hypothetical protein